jgi:hypothetical protein
MDRDIFFTLFYRVWGVVAGIVTIVLIPTTLTAVEQGYYYTFASGIGIQVFFELGLNQVVVQIVAHEIAVNSSKSVFEIEKNIICTSGLLNIYRFMSRWYLVMGLLFLVISSALGLWFLSKSDYPIEKNNQKIWIIIVFFTAINLWFGHRFSILEGHGKIATVAGIRFVQSIVGYILTWISMVLGGGVFSITIIPIVSAFSSLIWFNLMDKTFVSNPSENTQNASRLNWHLDVFPVQWRMAVSWISGYFVFHLIQFVVFKSFGPVEAGKIGLTFSIFAAITTVGLSWINAKNQLFISCASKGDYLLLNHTFDKVFTRSFAFVFLLSTFLPVLIYFMGKMGFQIVNRLPNLKILTATAVLTISNSVVFALATYMRAHRKEPMLPISVASAVLSVVLLYINSKINLNVLIYFHMLTSVVVVLPWSVSLYLKYRSRGSKLQNDFGSTPPSLP